MRGNVIRLLVGACIVAMLCLTGCGGGGGSSSTSANGLITGVGWLFENVAPDYYNDGSTCSMTVYVYYNESIAVDDIDSFSMTAPNGVRWTSTSLKSSFGTGSAGKPYIANIFVYSVNPNAFPLAGVWTSEIKLKNGDNSSLQGTLHEPGSSADATHRYLYTKEDWSPSTDSSQYRAALSRFPAQGYSIGYSGTDGGKITSTGLSAVRTSFLAAEPNAYNMYCWMYDADKAYLGCTNHEYSTLDHSSTNLITASGELSIVSASTSSSSGRVDLSKVKYIRFVYTDGAQFAPSSYSSINHRSVSSLIAVN
ncbi:MAG: hypothetical protein HZA20_02370 [Nitrospirae bacterium]|nr:hypothetical protein [Nitrospirota bacterium]